MKFKIITITSLILLCIFVAVCLAEINRLDEVNEIQSDMLIDLHGRIVKLENENEILKGKVDMYNKTTDQRIVGIWESVAALNNNLKALGLGYHLKKEDITPEEYRDED